VRVDPRDKTTAETIPPATMVGGAHVGGYRPDHILAQGGIGIVWAAHDPDLDGMDQGAAIDVRARRLEQHLTCE
jgi:hypothetical protein